MRINPIVYAFLVLAIFLGVIYAFRSAGVWSVTGNKYSQGQPSKPDAADVSTIRGWTTLEQIITAYDLTLEELIHAFNLPADTPATTAVKDLESDIFSLSGLRSWLEKRTAVEQSTPKEELAPPTPTPLPTVSVVSPQKGQNEEHSPQEYLVNAQVTFQDLLDWGLTQETIEQAIGMPMPDAAFLVKDYAIGQGLMFSEIKSQLQAELDKLR